MGFSGNRLLTPELSIWEHNSWDNVSWSEEQLLKAKEIVSKHQQNSSTVIDPLLSRKWDKFYKKNSRNFFKDRNWFESELGTFFKASEGALFSIFEIGCGTGSSIYPILAGTQNSVFIHACDYSNVAVDLVKNDPRFIPSRCNVFLHDISDPDSALPIKEQSVDLVLMIFVLSAIPRSQMNVAIEKALRVLKPGGHLFIRDYGLYDLAQLRMPPNNWIDGHQYKRGDNTLTYFFSKDDLIELVMSNHTVSCTIESIREDRRLLVNRKRQLQMFRVWIQGIFLRQ